MLTAERAAIIADKLLEAQAIEATIQTYRRESERAAEIGSDDLVRVYNLAIYVCLSEQDKNVLCVDALRTDESDHVRLSFIARQLATLLYEVAGDIRRKALTKPMRDTILAIDPSAEGDLNCVNSLAQGFWNRRGQELKRWRNVACAHRDFDAFLQLQAIQEIELAAVMEIAVEFTDIPRRLVSLLTNVLSKTIGLEGALKVLARSKRRKTPA